MVRSLRKALAVLIAVAALAACGGALPPASGGGAAPAAQHVRQAGVHPFDLTGKGPGCGNGCGTPHPHIP